MRIYSVPKGEGKTEMAMHVAIQLDIYLAVKDRNEVSRVFHQMKGKEKGLRFPITYDDIIDHRMVGSFIKDVVIDNIDDFVIRVCQRCGVTPFVGTLDFDFHSPQQIGDALYYKKKLKAKPIINTNHALSTTMKFTLDDLKGEDLE